MKDDLISRQAALDVIRPLQTYKLFEGNDMILVDKAEVQTELMMLPSAQPEIIRCKDCKHFEKDEELNMDVKRTERGWAAHFIAAAHCLFRRNTLLEYEERKWIVSTVGNYIPRNQTDPDTVGLVRWYETMVFEAKCVNGYIDADVTRQIETDNEWGIWGETWEEVMKTYHTPDNAANDMHERIVDEMTEKIQRGEQHGCHCQSHIRQKGEPMTDTERERIEAICEVAGVSDIEDLSDGFHTFRQLYYQRMMLFASIVKQNKDRAWKSLRHEDGQLCFGGEWFIVGIDTPEGSYTYHYEVNFYSLFDCKELERGKHWDGHTEKDVTRLLTLPSAQPEKVVGIKMTLSEEQLREAVEKAKNGIIQVLPSIQPEQRWIPCSERLPDDYTDVLAWFEYFRYGDYNCLYQTCGIGDYSAKYDSWMINHETGWHKLRVLAWMPLPEVYREESEQDDGR